MNFTYSLISVLALTSICLISFFPENVLGYHNEVVATPFTSGVKGVSINYPGEGNGDWVVQEDQDLIMFTSPQHSAFDQVLEGVDISVYPTQGTGVTEFADFLKNDFYPRADVIGGTFKPLQEQDAVISDREAYLLVYSYFDNVLNTDLQAMDVIIKEGDFFYLLTFTAEAGSYSLYLPIFTQMVESFNVFPMTSSGASVLGGTASSSASSSTGSDLTGGLGSGSSTSSPEGSDLTGGLGGP